MKQKTINITFKLLISLGFMLFLFKRIFKDNDPQLLWESFYEQCQSGNLWFLFCCMLLMPINWGLEILKWRTLMRPFFYPSFKDGLKSILAGAALSVFTPNRIGDYGGRAMFLPKEYKATTLLATATGNTFQFVCITIAGLVGLMFLTFRIPDLFQNLNGMLILGIGSVALFLFLFTAINFKKIFSFLEQGRWGAHFTKVKKMISTYSLTTLIKAFNISFLRYVVYAAQYGLLILFFGISNDVLLIGICVTIIFLIQTVIPIPPLLGLVARGGIAISIWGYFSDNEIGILAATFFLWMLNLITPAIPGMILILSSDVPKSFGYED